MPALFTSWSILPKCSMVLAMRALPPSGVETSLSSAMASHPRDRMRSATCSAIVESFPNPDTSAPKSFTTTRAPRSARSSAYARPSPRPAPVTTATFPSNEIRSVISLRESLGGEDVRAHNVPFNRDAWDLTPPICCSRHWTTGVSAEATDLLSLPGQPGREVQHAPDTAAARDLGEACVTARGAADPDAGDDLGSESIAGPGSLASGRGRTRQSTL